ncbi:MAG TPA: hypothetical protein VGV06_20990 [Methylomirabilota bacterium]|nr:hypothetical protein [Methylomirabilota bacterium]
MLLDTGHRRWIVAFLVLSSVGAVVFVPYARTATHGPRGGTWPGLVYGSIGLALILYAAALGVRRKVPSWRIGRATAWMKGHLWLGLLSYVVVLFHSGFKLGDGLTLVLMVLFTIVVVTGIYGVILQQFLPRMMLLRIPLETVYEQIDPVVVQLRAEADELVSAVVGPLPVAEERPRARRWRDRGLRHRETRGPSAAPPPPAAATLVLEGAALRESYVSIIRPYLGVEMPNDGRLATEAAATELFQHLRLTVPPPLHPQIQELEVICDERRQLAQQKRLHHWLHGWLMVHVPLSMALLLLAIVHAVMSMRY